jgi:hypothetical protein
MKKILFLILISFQLKAQIISNIELEIVGRPTWQILTPIQDKGLIFFIKTDQTQAKIFYFDSVLKKTWEKELFLDVERAPTAYTINSTHITFLFRETSGMYYQLFIFDLYTGNYKTKGFEVREFFDDQDYVFLGDKILMAGANETGAAFYEYTFDTEIGRLLSTDLKGKVKLQEMVFNHSCNQIDALWSVKTVGYSNEKKKKGEFIKDVSLNWVKYDTNATALNTKIINQKSGNFPMTGQKIYNSSQELEAISGTYQNSTGDKGLFLSIYNPSQQSFNTKYHSFGKLLSGQPEFQPQDLQKIIRDFTFMVHPPLNTSEAFKLGGVFFKTEFRTYSEQIYDPYTNDPFNRNNSVFGRSNTRTQSKTVFAGYNFLSGVMAEIDKEGNLINQNRLDLNQLSPQLKQAMGFNTFGSVAYCIKGNLAAKNFNIGNKPIIYKLSDEVPTPKNQTFLPYYNEVRHWHDEYFIADGSKSKVEVMQIQNVEAQKSTKKRKKKNAPVYTQIRKTIYLTKIASGQ